MRLDITSQEQTTSLPTCPLNTGYLQHKKKYANEKMNTTNVRDKKQESFNRSWRHCPLSYCDCHFEHFLEPQLTKVALLLPSRVGETVERNAGYVYSPAGLTCRAVHLEMAFGLDTDSFLKSFVQMATRPGYPQEIVSDRGTNFIKADQELQELLDALDRDKIKDQTANKGVKWFFNPLLAPHFGGVHKVMIKAGKKAIRAILGDADVNDKE